MWCPTGDSVPEARTITCRKRKESYIVRDRNPHNFRPMDDHEYNLDQASNPAGVRKMYQRLAKTVSARKV